MDKPAGTTLSFKLHNGRCGTLAPEAQRTYEAIVASNLGTPFLDGLTGKFWGPSLFQKS